MSHQITRRSFVSAGIGAGLVAGGAAGASSERPNVLFLAIDDLRCELNAYGRPWVKTPHIDRLAAEGVTFINNHCQIAVCSPSRSSVMTGLRPDTTRIFDLRTHFRKNLPDVVTLPQRFRQAGYATTSFSKIYHLGNHTPGGLDDPDSWSEPSWHPGGPKWGTSECRRQSDAHRAELLANQWTCDISLAGYDSAKGISWAVPSVESIDLPDSGFTDGQTAEAAIDALPDLKSRPFFLAVGYLNPHLPFVAPKRYFDMYPPGSEQIAVSTTAPIGVPECALHAWGELRSYTDIGFRSPMPDQKARQLIRGYYAATSFVDAQIGKLLDALDRHDLTKNTIVVLWGDNGFHLGDHGLWSKHSNFEEATHVPMIVRLPGKRAAGTRVEALTELADIYPSLCELAGLAPPQGLQGKSFVPLINNPAQPWKTAACSQFPRGVPGVGPVMGYSLRTARYRYTEWRPAGKPPIARELYDYRVDPAETANLVDRPSYQPIVRELSGRMKDFGTAALQEPSRG